MTHPRTKTNIVMFWFMDDWGKYGRAYENIARALAGRPEIGRVVCVLPPGTAAGRDYAWPVSFRHLSRKLVVLQQNTRPVPTLSAPYRLRRWINRKLPDALFAGVLYCLGIRKKNTLLWLYPPHPYIDKLTGLVPHHGTVVQIVDNNAFLESADDAYRDSVQEQYDRMVSQADRVIVSSEMNHSIFSAGHAHCYLFENAIDSTFLSQASPLPSQTAAVQPRLGYVGWITERTDTGLLLQLAKQRPAYRLVIAGPVVSADPDDIAELAALPNVDMPGDIPYSEVPELLRSFDVCLIPHIDTPYSKSMSPLKLFQYLGSGRPVVTTPVAGVDRWSELIYIAGDAAGFVAAIDNAIEAETPALAQARIAAVAAETWENRIAQILEIMPRGPG